MTEGNGAIVPINHGPSNQERALLGRKTKRPTVTEIEAHDRRNWICAAIAQGYTGYTLLQMVRLQFDLRHENAIAVISEARRSMRETFELERADLAVQLLAMHHEVFVAAMQAKQYSAAVGALASIGRLTGVEAPRA